MSELKYVDLDKFRFLTGHGKQFALAVDAAIEQCGWGSDGLSPGGQLQVWFRPSDGYSGHELITFEHPQFISIYKEKYPDIASPRASFSVNCIVATQDGQKQSEVSVPLWYISGANKQSYDNHYQIYSHTFFFEDDERGGWVEIEGPTMYIGVTKRGWRTRWQEHYRAAKSGSHYKFHEMIRKHPNAIAHHGVVGIVPTEAMAMAAEELSVQELSLFPKGLNMIPGGYAGMKYLHRIGAVGKGERVSPDDKHEIINRFFETASRRGLPNPLASLNWQNPEYAEKVICAGDDRLKPEQIRTARFLATVGKTSPEIANEIGARNVAQVDRLLAGSTYSRVA